MTIRVFQWQLNLSGSGGLEWLQEVDLSQTPDTVFFDFDSRENSHTFFHFESAAIQEVNSGIQTAFHHYEIGPILTMEVDLTQVPDTVFQHWEALGQAVVPFFPKDAEINPKTALFAGDMGAYIG